MSSRGESTRMLLKSNVCHGEEEVEELDWIIVHKGEQRARDTDLIFMGDAVSLDVRFRNGHGVTDQDAPAVCSVVNHHHDTRLLLVHHTKCAGKQTQHFFYCNQTPPFHQTPFRLQLFETHKAMRPCGARLNTTFPRTATPVM